MAHSSRSPGYSHGEAPAPARPHLVVRLKSGWRLDPKGASFVSARGRHVPPPEGLPAGTEVVPTAPALARRRAKPLNAAERELARYVQVILPAGADSGAWAESIRESEAVEDVSLPPRISLP